MKITVKKITERGPTASAAGVAPVDLAGCCCHRQRGRVAAERREEFCAALPQLWS